jgi:hypothetical protein
MTARSEYSDGSEASRVMPLFVGGSGAGRRGADGRAAHLRDIAFPCAATRPRSGVALPDDRPAGSGPAGSLPGRGRFCSDARRWLVARSVARPVASFATVACPDWWDSTVGIRWILERRRASVGRPDAVVVGQNLVGADRKGCNDTGSVAPVIRAAGTRSPSEVDARTPAGCGSRSGHHPGLRAGTQRAVEVLPLPGGSPDLSAVGFPKRDVLKRRSTQPAARGGPLSDELFCTLASG